MLKFHKADSTTVITIRGWFGFSIKRIILKSIRESKFKSIFINCGPTIISFYEFFALEIVHVLKDVIEKRPYDVNVRAVKKVIAAINKNTWLGSDDKPILEILDRSKLEANMLFTPLLSQESVFKDFTRAITVLRLRGILMHADAGTGKTFMSLAVAEMYGCDKIIIIAPNAAIDRVWVNSINTTLYKSPPTNWSIKSKAKYDNERISIFNYEAVNKALGMSRELRGKKTLVIVDESHNVNELTSKRTVQLHKLIASIGNCNVLLLSGTPVKALGKEVVSILIMLDPFFITKVRKHFINYVKGNNALVLNTLKQRMGIISSRLEKKEIKLKSLTVKEIFITLPNNKDYLLSTIKEVMRAFVKERALYYNDNFTQYEKTYNNIIETYRSTIISNQDIADFKQYLNNIKVIKAHYANNSLRDIPDIIIAANKYENRLIIPTLSSLDKPRFRDAKSVIKYVVLKIQGEALGKIITQKRIQCHVDIAKNIKYDAIIKSTLNKTVIFTNYINIAKEVVAQLTDLKYNVVGVYGDSTGKLPVIVKNFTHNKNINPLVATFKSLSTAVPLIVADTMIIIDMPFRSYIYEQAVSRLHRLGQTDPVIVYIIKLDTGGEDNINTRNIDIIKWSMDQVRAITGVDVEYDVVDNTVTTEELDWKIELEEDLPSLTTVHNDSNKYSTW